MQEFEAAVTDLQFKPIYSTPNLALVKLLPLISLLVLNMHFNLPCSHWSAMMSYNLHRNRRPLDSGSDSGSASIPIPLFMNKPYMLSLIRSNAM